MRQVLGRLIGCLALTTALLIEPRAGLPASPGMVDEDPLAECARKIEKMFSRVTIQVQELALDHAKLRQVDHSVVIPLKEPRGGIRAIQWGEKDRATSLEFIRLLRAGKIGAVSVWPFLHAPGDLYVARGIPLEVVKSCQKEQLQEVLGRCTDCDVAEWLNVKP